MKPENLSTWFFREPSLLFPVLIELSLPFVKTGGHFIAFKSKEAENELRDAAFAIKTLGGEFETIMQRKTTKGT